MNSSSSLPHSSQVKAIRASLTTNGQSGSKIRTVQAQMPDNTARLSELEPHARTQLE